MADAPRPAPERGECPECGHPEHSAVCPAEAYRDTTISYVICGCLHVSPPSPASGEKCPARWMYLGHRFGPGCAKERGHDGKHRNAQGEVWTDTDVPGSSPPPPESGECSVCGHDEPAAIHHEAVVRGMHRFHPSPPSPARGDFTCSVCGIEMNCAAHVGGKVYCFDHLPSPPASGPERGRMSDFDFNELVQTAIDIGTKHGHTTPASLVVEARRAREEAAFWRNATDSNLKSADEKLTTLDTQIAALRAEGENAHALYREADAARIRAEATAARLRKQYEELLYAVARKFPGETRHETALRYIREIETRECAGASAALKEKP